MKKNIDLRKKDWTVTEIKASGIPGWNGGAYTIAFIYSNQGNFILKGFYREVREHLNTLTKGGLKWFGNLTLWHHIYGRSGHRSIWDFWKENVHIVEPSRSRYSKRWTSKWRIIKFSERSYTASVELDKVEFKRLPQKWVPELNKL